MASMASRNLTSTLLSHAGIIPNNNRVPHLQTPQRLQKMKNGGVKSCKVEEMKREAAAKRKGIWSEGSMVSTMAAAVASAAANAGPAVALVDERLSTEGTGLPFGLSNNLLGWILFGVFGLIWAFYFIYASSLDEDEDSGLSL